MPSLNDENLFVIKDNRFEILDLHQKSNLTEININISSDAYKIAVCSDPSYVFISD